jgi:hypothetical protein
MMRVNWIVVCLFVILGGCTTVQRPTKPVKTRMDAIEGKLDQTIKELRALRKRFDEFEDVDDEDDDEDDETRPYKCPSPPFDYSTGVKKLGEYKYQISKKIMGKQLADLESLGCQARVIPNYQHGKHNGFKLYGIRPLSFYRAIGIRSGDIIRSVNGTMINSPNKAVKMFFQLRNSSHVKIEIERGRFQNGFIRRKIITLELVIK